MRVIAVLALAPLLLAGQCQSNAPRTAQAECRVFPEGPPHVITTPTRTGQLWVDEHISVGVNVCGWAKPGAVKMAPPAAATSVDACPFDIVREDRRRLARAVAAVRQASEAELASLRASYGVSRRQFTACVADAEAVLR